MDKDKQFIDFRKSAVSVSPREIEISPDIKRRIQLGNELETIAKYNREHDTHFYKIDQVDEHKRMLEESKIDEKLKKNNFLTRMGAQSATDAGWNPVSANLITIGENDRARDIQDMHNAITMPAAVSAVTVPLTASMFAADAAAYGLVGAAGKWGGGMAGSTIASKAFSEIGKGVDKFASNHSNYKGHWGEGIGDLTGVFVGWGPGSKLFYNAAKKGVTNFATKYGWQKMPKWAVTDNMWTDIVNDAMKNGYKYEIPVRWRGFDMNISKTPLLNAGTESNISGTAATSSLGAGAAKTKTYTDWSIF